MHELGIAVQIVETVEAELAPYPGSRVTSVALRIGKLSGVVPEALEFAWPAATEGTPLYGSRLEMQLIDGVAWCPLCENETPLSDRTILRCPACGQAAPEMRTGQDLEVRSIEIREAEPSGK